MFMVIIIHTDGKLSAPILPPAKRFAFLGMFISLGETNPYN